MKKRKLLNFFVVFMVLLAFPASADALTDAGREYIATNIGTDGCFVYSGLTWNAESVFGDRAEGRSGGTAKAVNHLILSATDHIEIDGLFITKEMLRVNNEGNDVTILDVIVDILKNDGYPIGENQYCIPKTSIPEIPEAELSRIVFITEAQTLLIGEKSGVMIIQMEDELGESANVETTTMITLSSSSATGRFSLTVDPWEGISEVAILAGENMASFYYRDTNVGMVILSVAESIDQGWLDATQEVNIISPTPTPTATPIITPTVMPRISSTPTPISTPIITPTAIPMSTPIAISTVTPTLALIPTSIPIVTPTPDVTVQVTKFARYLDYFFRSLAG